MFQFIFSFSVDADVEYDKIVAFWDTISEKCLCCWIALRARVWYNTTCLSGKWNNVFWKLHELSNVGKWLISIF